MKFPPPPSEPPPPHTPGFKYPIDNNELTNNNKSIKYNKNIQTVKEQNIRHEVSNNENDASRIISNNKICPSKPALPSLPKAKSLYDYKPQDKDEIELKEGDILEILKERKFKLKFKHNYDI